MKLLVSGFFVMGFLATFIGLTNTFGFPGFLLCLLTLIFLLLGQQRPKEDDA